MLHYLFFSLLFFSIVLQADLLKKSTAHQNHSNRSTKQPDSSNSRAYFPQESIWYKDISTAAIDPHSDQIIQGLEDAGGWGNGNIFQIDFSFKVLRIDSDVPKRSFIPTEDFFEPDCDIASIPVPSVGSIEGNPGYECTDDGDCHLIVADFKHQKLYEMWRANITGGTFYGGCLAVWEMTVNYPPSGRGEECTSADAAGLPIAPLLFNADEVSAGEIKHAIRFILPNDRIRHGYYVHPATHSTGATGGGVNTPPYGARFRLKANFDMNRLPSEAARTVARALQKYGMFLADGGNIALTAENDMYTTAKWNGLLGSRDLDVIKVSDFEMVEAGDRIPYNGDCVRSEIQKEVFPPVAVFLLLLL